MPRAVVFHEVGGPEVLKIENIEVGEPGPGEVRIRVDAIGLNRGEVLFRAGTYWLQPSLPSSRLGHEAAGVIEAGAAHVLTAEPDDLIKEIHDLTDGRGADLIFDAVSGPGLQTLAQVVAPNGKLIVTSNLDPRPTPLPWTWPLRLHKYANPIF